MTAVLTVLLIAASLADAHVPVPNSGPPDGVQPTGQQGDTAKAAQERASASFSLPILRNMLTSEDPDIRGRALAALSRSESSGAVGLCVGALADEDEGVRSRAIEALNALGGDTAARMAMDAIMGKDGAAAPAWAVIQALPRLCKGLEAPLVAVLKSEEHAQRHAVAAFCLGKMKTPEAKDLLYEKIWVSEGQVVHYCFLAFTEYGEEVTGELSELAHHPNAYVRWQAVWTLGQIGGPVALAALGGIMNDPKADIATRAEAATVLGAVGGRDNVPSLISALGQGNAVSAAAGHALRAITGQRFGNNPGQWQQWYDKGPARPRLTKPPAEVEINFRDKGTGGAK